MEWVHPPTAKLLIAVGVRAFGYEPWAWRLASAVAGTLLAPVFFLFARRALATERAALLASLLLLADGVYLVQSRIAMTNIFAVLFQCLAALCVLRAGVPERLSAASMTLLGALPGPRPLHALDEPRGPWASWASCSWPSGGSASCGRARLLLVFLAFAVDPIAGLCRELPAPAASAATSAWPGPSPTRSTLDRRRPAGRATSGKSNARSGATTPTSTPPIPTSAPGTPGPGSTGPPGTSTSRRAEFVRGIVAIGNPALWWVAVPATLWALVTGARDRDPRRLFAGPGLRLPLPALGGRPPQAQLQPLPVRGVPYACLSLGMILDRDWDGARRFLARGVPRPRVAAVLPLPALADRHARPLLLVLLRDLRRAQALVLVPDLDLTR